MGNKKLFDKIPSSQFGISGDKVVTKELSIDTNDQPPQTHVTIRGNPATSGTIVVTLPATTGTLALTGVGPVGFAFTTIQTPDGTSPVATGPSDTLTLTSSSGDLVITGNAVTDTVDFAISPTSPVLGDYVLKSGDAMGGQLDMTTVGYSDATLAADLTDSSKFLVNGTDTNFILEADGTQTFGPNIIIHTAGDGVGVTAVSKRNIVFGTTDTGFGSLIEARRKNSLVFGFAENGGAIYAVGTDTSNVAHGRALSADSVIASDGDGSYAGGVAESGAYLRSSSAGTFVYGYVSGGSTAGLSSSGPGSAIFGYVEAGHAQATNTGQFMVVRMAGGQALGEAEGGFLFTSTDCDDTSYVRTQGEASSAFIKLDGVGCEAEAIGDGSQISGKVVSAFMYASGDGAIATGYVADGATLLAQGTGAKVGGLATGAGSLIQADTGGSFAQGLAINGGQILCIGDGSALFASVNGVGSVASAEAQGCLVNAFITNGGVVRAQGDGGFVVGVATGAGSILESTNASTAFGYAGSGGLISSQGTATCVIGTATGGSSVIGAGDAQLVFGYAINGGTIRLDGPASMAVASDVRGDVTALGDSVLLVGSDLAGVGFNWITMIGSNLTADEDDSIYLGYTREMLRLSAAGGVLVKDPITLYQHEKTTGTAPTIAPNANAGTGATAVVSTNSTDIAGEITLTTGTGILVAGAQLTLTFDTPYATAPIVVITAVNAAGAILTYVTATTTDFTINSLAGLTLATAYKYNYRVMETV